MPFSLGIGMGLPFLGAPGAVTPAYNPATVFGSDLLLWYDFGDTSRLWQDTVGGTPCSANGQPIGAVEDKTGGANHATQGTAAAKPTRLDPGGLVPTMASFDGGDRIVSTTFANIPQPFTIIGVANITNNTGAMVDGAAPRTIVQRGANATTISINNGAGVSFGSANPDLSARRALYAEFNGASSKSYINNVLQATGNAGALGCTNLSVGGIPGDLMIGEVGEVLLVDRVLTVQERADLFTNYLQIRWGL